VHAGTRIRVESQVLASGRPPSWPGRRLFDGVVEKMTFPGATIQLSCRDLSSNLQRTWIREQRFYGVWQPARRYVAGAVVIPLHDDPNTPAVTRYMQAQTTGTTGGSEPSWPAKSSGGIVTDGGVTWLEQTVAGTAAEVHLQMLLDDNLGAGAVALYCPSSPDYFIRDYQQVTSNVWDALRLITDQIGWDLRYRWDDSAGEFLLTLSDPGRGNTTPDFELGPDKYRPASECALELQSIRNVIEVKFYDRGTLGADGNPTPSTYTATDAASVARYGTQWMGVAEDGASQIDTAAEAQALAEAILSDLAEPGLQLVVSVEHMHFLQLHDLVTVKADGVRFSADQLLAVCTIRHSFKGGAGVTALGFRGKPATGQTKWHAYITSPGLNGPNLLVNQRAPLGVVASGSLAGGTIHYAPPTNPRFGLDVAELHLSLTSGFTPGPTTRVQTGRAGRFDVTGLPGSTEYFARVLHRDRKGNPGPMSPEVHFTTQGPAMQYLAKVTLSADWAYAKTPVPFDLDLIDYGGTWDLSTHKFTAPVDGFYRFNVQLELNGAQSTDRQRIWLEVNDGSTTYRASIGAWALPAGPDASSSSTFVVLAELADVLQLEAGWTVQVQTDYDAASIATGQKLVAPGGTTLAGFHRGSFVQYEFLHD
jgi:hypothetical protein